MSEALMDSELFSRIRSCNLKVLGWFDCDGLTVEDVFHRVVHIDVVPVKRIPADSVDIGRKVNEYWGLHARSGGVIADDGTFLVAGSLEGGWVSVKMIDNVEVFNFREASGDILFVARSASGHHVCAVSREGSEYWIIEVDFPEG
ncbi:hypothetical protein [Streptomyces sp. 4F14]|uniref:hypothetical protein n=1 Tax=Streptomyces sp. 4F14 TaxID=3394380 RepID=UPI003A876C63